ncbi:MAG: type II secretion system F family protein [Planctomycetota bacterium]
MTTLAAIQFDWMQVMSSLIIFVGVAVMVFLGARPGLDLILWQENRYDQVLRRQLLWPIAPRAATIVTGIMVLLIAAAGWGATGSGLGALFGAILGMLGIVVLLAMLRRRWLRKLEDQLVGGIQTLASGVRAGLNLVQAMQLVARDGPNPLRQEVAHLLREYEYGLGLEDAMNNTADRIGSSDYRLLFAALLTHRQRGGDLGITLDRIAESIREIQRLEKRVETLTAQGRATARWLGAMPVVVLLILYFLVDPSGVTDLFQNDIGKLMLLVMVVLNIIGFLWIKKIVNVDI